MPSPALVFALLAFPFVDLVERGARGQAYGLVVWGPALALLAVSCAARAAVAVRVPAWRVLGLVPLALVWCAFYALDLHRARFAWTLLLVPVGAGVGVMTRRVEGVALGALAALTVVWALMIPRADNGCTGVSPIYGLVSVLHPVLGLLPAPWLLARNGRSRDDS